MGQIFQVGHQYIDEETLKNERQKILDILEDLKKEKDKNRIYQKDMIILLDTNAEQRNKIIDLENNIELLVNNLSEQNKELISDYQSQN